MHWNSLTRPRGTAGLLLVLAASGLSGFAASGAEAHGGHSHFGHRDSPVKSGSAVRSTATQPARETAAFYGAGDASGYHVYRADSANDATWRELANIRPGDDQSDSWIGYQCVTGDGRYVVAVVAQRRVTNRPLLADTGGTAYAVSTQTGNVRPLASGVAVKYHNPGCGSNSQVALSSYAGPEGSVSTLRVFDASSGRVVDTVTQRQHLTSAIPTKEGIVAAAGSQLLTLSGHRVVRRVPAGGLPFQIRTGAQGEVTYLAHSGDNRADVRVMSRRGTAKLGDTRLQGARLLATRDRPVLVGADIDLRNGAGSSVAVYRKPESVASVDAVSGDGATLVTQRAGQDPEVRGHDHTSIAELPRARPVLITRGDNGATRTSLPEQSEVEPVTALPPTVSAFGNKTVKKIVNTTTPKCAVPRNSLTRQVPQPSTDQVNWAIQQAVRGNLKGSVLTRPANFLNMGLASYQPSSDFSAPALAGGGQVPPSVVQAIYAQETNWKQASFHALPGLSGNPLVSDYYGAGGTVSTIDYDKADCGYGVSQITDPMSMSGTQFSANGKAKVAVDYAENITAGLQILGSKWNQLKNAGITINNANPIYLENWYFAIWAYNSGFYAQSGTAPWGLGWTNNPQNSDYDPTRVGFLRTTYADASHPADWPYQERVIGFMESPLLNYKGKQSYLKPVRAGASTTNLTLPPRTAFCTMAGNECSPTYQAPNGQHNLDFCTRGDRKCWWHQPVTYADCDTNCTRSGFSFSETATEPATDDNYPPACSSTMPTGTIIVDNQPSNLNTEGCGSTNWSNAGTFTVVHGSSGGVPVGEIDWHQLGTGFGGHTYFTHNRASTDPAHTEVGTWTPNGITAGTYDVAVHVPTSGASTEAVTYTIHRGDGTTATRTINQHIHANRWVSLGSYNLQSGAKVVLTNVSSNTSGTTTVAYDAVGFKKTAADVSTTPPGDLAKTFRPSLFFDSSEKWRPLDVDEFFAERQLDGSGAHARCLNPNSPSAPDEFGHDPIQSHPDAYDIGDGSSTDSSAVCIPIRSAADLVKWGSKDTFIQVNRTLSKSETDYTSPYAGCSHDGILDCNGNEAGLTTKSAIYSDVSSRSGEKFIQYWFYYRFNSFSDGTDIGNHQSDWEGFAISPSDNESTFKYAAFTAHGQWYSYLRSNLECTDQSGTSCGTTTGNAKRVKVYVANGSHGNYAKRCDEQPPISFCGQSIEPRPERGHDGQREWGGNGSVLNLRTLTPVGGKDWNNWAGSWSASGDPLGDAGIRGPVSQPGGLYFHPWGDCFKSDGGCPRPTSARFGNAKGSKPGAATAETFASCASWFGADVNALACDPNGLVSEMARGRMREGSGITLKIVRELRPAAYRERRSDHSAGARVLAQSVGTPLRAGDAVRVRGHLRPGTVIQVRVSDDKGRPHVARWVTRDSQGPSSLTVAAQGSRYRLVPR